MKLNHSDYKATVYINKDGELYMNYVGTDILVFGDWAGRLKHLAEKEKFPGVYVYKTDIDECCMMYVEGDEAFPIVSKIKGFGKYVVLEDYVYNDFRKMGMISNEEDARFKRLFECINNMLDEIEETAEVL